jgi:hypothetical protein
LDPAGTRAQVPAGAPGAEQLEHASVHGVLQQTPCTQLPLRHCAAVLHIAPFCSVGLGDGEGDGEVVGGGVLE